MTRTALTALLTASLLTACTSEPEVKSCQEWAESAGDGEFACEWMKDNDDYNLSEMTADEFRELVTDVTSDLEDLQELF